MTNERIEALMNRNSMQELQQQQSKLEKELQSCAPEDKENIRSQLIKINSEIEEIMDSTPIIGEKRTFTQPYAGFDTGDEVTLTQYWPERDGVKLVASNGQSASFNRERAFKYTKPTN